MMLGRKVLSGGLKEEIQAGLAQGGGAEFEKRAVLGHEL